MLNSVFKGNYDIIFHQAAIPRVSYSVDNPTETTETNILKTVNLFKSCDGNVKRIVSASSSSIYGGSENLPTKETEPKNPKSPYAWQKSAIEDFAKIACDLYDLDIVCLRYFNVFGPRNPLIGQYTPVVAIFQDQTSKGKDLTIVGDGEQRRDFTHVLDIVDGLVRCGNSLLDDIEQPNNIAGSMVSGEIFELGTGKNYSINEVVKLYKSDSVNIGPRLGEMRETLCTDTKAYELLGWKPTYTLEEYIAQKVKEYDEKTISEFA